MRCRRRFYPQDDLCRTNPVLAIGPSSYAGQATAWAQAVVSDLPVQAWSFPGVPLRGGGFHFEVDELLGRIGFRTPTTRGWRAGRLFDGATHVAPDGFMSFARWDRAAHFQSDARRLAEMGYWMALIAHGSDVRNPSTHMTHDQWSCFAVGDEKWRSSPIRRTELNRSFAASYGWPVFHFIPDMGFDLPFSTWLPMVVNVEAWASDVPLLEREKLLVVHVPSQRKPPIKGTQFISPVLWRLHNKGAIEHAAPPDLSHAQLRELMRSCNMVVDQAIFGSYGVAAVEAMATDRVYVGRMSGAVRDQLPESPHLLEATPDDLYEVIASIRDRHDELRTRTTENRAFAEEWYDGRVLAERLAPFLRVD